jgi:hypothetical protein
MECAHACDAVKLEFRKFGYSDNWLHIFRIFPFIAGFWSMHILWRRTEFIGKDRRLSVFLVSSILPVVYILLSLLVLVGVLFFPVQHLHRH